MTKHNNRAKRDARRLQADSGMKYTEARRASDRPAGSPHSDPVVRTAYGWVDSKLVDSSVDDLSAAAEYVLDLPEGAQYVLEEAQVARAHLSGLGVERDLIEEYEDGLRLVAATFEVDVALRGFVSADAAADIVTRGVGELVEEVDGDAHVVMRPRTAVVQLTFRIDESDAIGEVLQVDSFTWL